MKISWLTIFLIIITVISLTTYVVNMQVTNVSHFTSDSLYEMIMEHNGSKEVRQILTDTYDAIKNIELNQKTNTSVSYTRFMMFLIFTVFSYKLDKSTRMK